MLTVKDKQLLKTLRHPSTQMLAALILFIVSAILVHDGELEAWERWVFEAIYSLPNELTPLFIVITQFGGVLVLLCLGAIFIIKKRYNIVIRMLMSGLMADLLAHVGKSFVGRPRPVDLFTELSIRDPFTTGVGFPSGHTALATAAALVLGHYLPKKYKWIAPVWIISVAVSRVYLGVHAPMDLVGGFALGWFSVSLFRHVQLRDIRK